MMKKSVMTCALVLLVCLWLTSGARAAIVSGSDKWGITLDANESITAIAHFVWGGVEFTALPLQITGLGYDAGGIWGDIGWQAELAPDNKIAYMYGPQSTNITESNDVGWFSYELSYQWDDAAVGFDSNYPVYIDTAIYDGPFGSEPTNYWGWRGTPGITNSWEYRDVPYYIDDPEYEEGFYDNPAPEPMTICLLGLGTAFLRKKRRRKTLSLYKLQ
jgi:hypothetical protein